MNENVDQPMDLSDIRAWLFELDKTELSAVCKLAQSVWQQQRGTNRENICGHCGQPFMSNRIAKYCGGRCRTAAHRAKAKENH